MPTVRAPIAARIQGSYQQMVSEHDIGRAHMTGIAADNWIVLDVCATCYIHVSGCGEVHTESDQLSASALDRDWTGYHMWNDCGGDDCEEDHRYFDGQHAGGFTYSACGICGQGGRGSFRVIADPVSPAALQDMAAQTYIWGWSYYGWKAIPGARTYTQAGRHATVSVA